MRVRSAGDVKPALRLAVKNEISQLQLRPNGMSPSAVLMVRHVLDPRVNKKTSDKHINNTAWRQAVRDQLQDTYRHAARPNCNGVSGDPQAVLFRDQAELIATLIVDIVTNRVAGKWWWRSFSFRTWHASSQLRDVLQIRTEIIPAVFAILSRQGQAIGVVKSLDGDDAYHLMHAILHQFGCQQLSGNLIAAPQQYPQADVPDRFIPDLLNSDEAKETFQPRYNFRTDDLTDSPAQKCSRFKTCRLPPWVVLLGDTSWSAELSREQNALLGISQILHTATAMVRNSSFQQELVRWWQLVNQSSGDYYKADIPNSEKRNQKIRSRSIEFVQEKINATEHIENDTDHLEGNETERFHARTEGRLAVAIAPESGATDQGIELNENNKIEFEARTGFDPGNDEPSEIENHLLSEDNDAVPLSISAGGKERHMESKTNENQCLVSEELLLDELDLHYSEIYIDTGLGGVLYIINLLKQLGIPEHFNESWSLDKQISYWAMTEIIARALLGKLFLKCDNDSIWRILAKLDRRRNRFSIAQKYRCGADYVIPTQWFQYLINSKEESFFLGVYQNRLRVWTKDIPLIDTRIDSSSDPQQVAIEHISRLVGEKETVEYLKLQQRPFREAPLDNCSHLLRLGFNKDLAVWLSLVLPVIRRYLQSALSLDSANSTSLLKTFFALQARIYISACHIDLVADVNQSSLVLRRSGLDQDPGWQPEFGRVILFHFQ